MYEYLFRAQIEVALRVNAEETEVLVLAVLVLKSPSRQKKPYFCSTIRSWEFIFSACTLKLKAPLCYSGLGFCFVLGFFVDF